MSGDGISQTGPEGGNVPAGGAEQDTERVAALERRYQRLLRCYPPRHREVHQEEMLGVLLATARAGQETPSAGQTVNLIACGLAIRARRALSWLLAGEPWQDTLAVVSLIAPAVMLIIATLDFAGAADPAGPPLDELVPRINLLLPATGVILWLAVVLLGLTGLRWAAAAIALVQFALAVVAFPGLAVGLSPVWFGGLGFWTPIAVTSLAVCSLAFSAGPRRGIAIVGRRRAIAMIGAFSVGYGLPVIANVLSPVVLTPDFAASQFMTVQAIPNYLAVLAIAVPVVIVCLRGIVNWRITIMAAPVLLLFVMEILPVYGSVGPGYITQLLLWLAGLVLVVIVWTAAIASWRGRVGRASHAAEG